MTILQHGIKIGGNIFSLWWTVVSSAFFLFLFILMEAISIARQIKNYVMEKISSFVSYCLNDSLPVKIGKYCLSYGKNLKNSFIYSLQDPRSPLLRPLLRENQIQRQINTIRASAAANPDEITQNQKVLMLMQKMRKLQQTVFQQSVDRRKAEGELFELKVSYQQKNAELIKERTQCVQNLNKINMLKMQLHQKNEDLTKSKKRVQDLEQQVKHIKQEVIQIQKNVEIVDNKNNQSNVEQNHGQAGNNVSQNKTQSEVQEQANDAGNQNQENQQNQAEAQGQNVEADNVNKKKNKKKKNKN